MLAGLAIDALDLLTYGPIGIYAGMILGGVVGWWLAPRLGFPPHARWICALATGIYCTVPLTGFVPAAMLAAGITQALLQDPDRGRGTAESDPALRPEGAIDAEFEVLEDQPPRETARRTASPSPPRPPDRSRS